MRVILLGGGPLLFGLLAGCVDPSSRIASGLQRYGLDAGQAQCVGQRLEDDLSLGQLRQLGRAADAYHRDDATPGRPTPSDLLRVSAELKDARVPLEVAKAAAGCGVVQRRAG